MSFNENVYGRRTTDDARHTSYARRRLVTKAQIEPMTQVRQKVSEYDKEIPQSHTACQPTAP